MDDESDVSEGNADDDDDDNVKDDADDEAHTSVGERGRRHDRPIPTLHSRMDGRQWGALSGRRHWHGQEGIGGRRVNTTRTQAEAEERNI